MACLISFLQQAQKARGIHPELRKYFYKEYSNLTWEEFLTTKVGLWVVGLRVRVLKSPFMVEVGQ